MFTVCQHSLRYLFKFRCSALLGRGLGSCGSRYMQDLNLSYLYSTRFAVICVNPPLLPTLEIPRELRSLWCLLHDLTGTVHQNKPRSPALLLLFPCAVQQFPLEGNPDMGAREEAHSDQVPDLGEPGTRMPQRTVSCTT